MDILGENAIKVGIVASLGQVASNDLTERHLDLIGSNAINAGIIERAAKEAPWSALMEITDTITSSESRRITEGDNNSPALTNTLVRFDGTVGRDRFQHMAESLFAGIPSSSMPRIRQSSSRELVIHDFPYSDNATLGRLATALLRKQYEGLGPMRRSFTQSSIERIMEGGLLDYLPEELAERAQRQGARLGSQTLLSSGNISIIGRAMREALVPADELEKAEQTDTKKTLLAARLPIQRARGNRPFVEGRARFVSSGEPIPISQTPMRIVLTDQVGGRVADYQRPYKEHDWNKVMQDMWSLGSGLGVVEIAAAVIRAGWTVTRASEASTRGMIVDWWKRKRGSGREEPEEPKE